MSALSVLHRPTRLRRPLAVGSSAILALAGAAAITVATGGPTRQVRNGASVAAIPYSYTPEAAANVKADVTAGAGVGKVG